ncbi:hypothetical protein V1514DRAFT_59833 [Lipomyces japonicus]|uniref:uncharacterized protein n=1 Tax=Lipomyces japonicus TaxID=56871 RepID=UPI0034CDFAFD
MSSSIISQLGGNPKLDNAHALSVDNSRYARQDWSIPAKSRINISDVPDILIAIFGRFRTDSFVTNNAQCINSITVHDPPIQVSQLASATDQSPDNDQDDDRGDSSDHETTKTHARVISPISDNKSKGQPRLYYSSVVEAPFEVFGLKLARNSTDTSSASPGQPFVANTEQSLYSHLPISDNPVACLSFFSAADAKQGGDNGDGANQESAVPTAASKSASQHEHTLARLAKLLPHPAGLHKVKKTVPPRRHHITPSSQQFHASIKLPPDTGFRSISPEEWDPQNLYSYITVAVSAAAGGPTKIFQATGADGKAWYWIVAKLADSNIVVGVSTYAVFSFPTDCDEDQVKEYDLSKQKVEQDEHQHTNQDLATHQHDNVNTLQRINKDYNKL